MSVRATKSGLSRDQQMKMDSKYNPELATQCLEWIQDTIRAADPQDPGADFTTDGSQDNFFEVLNNGVVLAKFLNGLKPGAVSASAFKKPPTLAFKKMELIGQFLDGISKHFNIQDQDKFQTVDLYERQNLHQVVVTIQTLGRKCKSMGMGGFGPKEAEANVREFSDEQMQAGRNVIGLQMGSNKGASQAGMNIGKTRAILD